MPDEAWGRIAIERLRPVKKQEFGHAAAFEHAPRCVQRMGEIKQPVMLVVLDDGLAQATRDAKKYFKTPVTIADDNYGYGAYFNRAKDVADAVRRFQDS